MIVTVKVIVPDHPLIDTAKMDAAINKALDKTAEEAKESFEKTVATWNNKPPFMIEKGTFERRVFTSNDIYFYVSGGTKVRRVIMTPGFTPKTRYRFIGSGPGFGGVAFGPSKTINRPGIKAREFEIAIALLYKRFFPIYVQDAIDEAVK